MAKFLSEIIMILALGLVLYLLAKTLPRVDDVEKRSEKVLKIHWFTPLLEKIDERLKILIELFFRRLKVIILKLDNFVSVRLNKIKKDESKEVGSVLTEEKTEEIISSDEKIKKAND